MHTGRILTWGGYALALAAAPLVFSSSLSLQVLSQVGIAIIACLSYGLLLGQGGLLSFGHAVYSGAGAFLAIHTLNALGAGRLGLPVSLLPLAGGVAALAVGSVFGWLSTRRAGTPFAMITLGLGELAWAASLMFTGVFGGEGGISSNRVVGARPWGISFGPQLQLYGLIAAYAFASTALMFAFTRTPLGRVLNAVRDNPERVEFLGFDPRVVRWIAFMVSSFFAGVAGALAALNFEIVTAEVFSAHRSGAYLLFTFLGGATFFFGPGHGAGRPHKTVKLSDADFGAVDGKARQHHGLAHLGMQRRCAKHSAHQSAKSHHGTPPTHQRSSPDQRLTSLCKLGRKGKNKRYASSNKQDTGGHADK